MAWRRHHWIHVCLLLEGAAIKDRVGRTSFRILKTQIHLQVNITESQGSLYRYNMAVRYI